VAITQKINLYLRKNYGDFKFLYNYIRETQVVASLNLPKLPEKRSPLTGIKKTGAELMTEI